MRNKLFTILFFVTLFFDCGSACFSSILNKKNQTINNGEEDFWVPNMDKLPNKTKEVAKEIMDTMDDAKLSTLEMCQKLKGLYDGTSELDKQLLHILWWREIDCKGINESIADPFYPFDQGPDPNPERLE